jgi:hypothetical protein
LHRNTPPVWAEYFLQRGAVNAILFPTKEEEKMVPFGFSSFQKQITASAIRSMEQEKRLV